MSARESTIFLLVLFLPEPDGNSLLTTLLINVARPIYCRLPSAVYRSPQANSPDHEVYVTDGELHRVAVFSAF